jgi:zinc-ribbon domain
MTADDHRDAEPSAAGTAGPGDEDGGAEPAEDVCWNCGSPLPDGAIFCGECGSAVASRPARAAEPDAPQPSEGPDESGLPPHGDALLETPTAEDGVERTAEDVAEDGAEPGDQLGLDGSAMPSDDQNEAGTPPHGDALIESPVDDAQPQTAGPEPENDAAPDSAPTEVQPILDDEGLTAGDPLAPLTPEERFAAERLLDPDSPADKFVLQFSTGESATVFGSGLVGRNPVAEPGEYVDHLVVLRDPGRSVSKTHLEFGQDNGAFWVLDRFSGNGSVLRAPETPPRRCEPGRRYFVSRGTRIEIGDQFFVVS